MMNTDFTARCIAGKALEDAAGKQDALTTKQLAAVNSGITSTDVEQIQTNKNNITSCLKYNVAYLTDAMLDELASGTITSGNAAVAIAGFSDGGWCTVETIPLNEGTGANERKYQRILMLTGSDGGKSKYRMYTGSWNNWVNLS